MRFLPLFLLLLSAGCAGPTSEDAALARYFRGLYFREALDSPARYQVEQISARWWHTGELTALEGKWPASAAELAAARERLGNLKEEIEKGRRWEVPVLAVCIPKYPEALELQGEFPLEETAVSEPATRWRLSYDDEALRVEAEFPGAVVLSHTEKPWEGDALELFILPDRRLRCYREIVVNPDMVLFTALHTKSRDEPWVGGFPEKNTAITGKAERNEAGWRVGLRIPFRELPGYFRGNPPKSGEVLHFSLLRTRPGRVSSAYPLLYDGHNLNGMIAATLK